MIRRGRIVVLAIAALVGGVVIVQAVLGESDSGRERASERLALTGPDAPTARALPGSLYVTREGCEAGHIDFATVALHVSPSRGCDPAAPHGSVRASGVVRVCGRLAGDPGGCRRVPAPKARRSPASKSA